MLYSCTEEKITLPKDQPSILYKHQHIVTDASNPKGEFVVYLEYAVTLDHLRAVVAASEAMLGVAGAPKANEGPEAPPPAGTNRVASPVEALTFEELINWAQAYAVSDVFASKGSLHDVIASILTAAARWNEAQSKKKQ